MKITWKDSARSWKFVIKEGKYKIEGNLTKQNKNSSFHISCKDLKLDKDICDDKFFAKRKISNDNDKINLAKEEAINIIKKTLIGRKNTYEKILNENMDDLLTWKKPTVGDIIFYDFSFMDEKKKICGNISFINGESTSYLELPWMGKRQVINSSKEDEFKNELFEIMRRDSFEKLEILKKF